LGAGLEGSQQRTMLEDEFAEAAEVHLRKRRVLRADEVLVEPLRFFYLEAYSLDGREFFVR
jgi:hypothetical protein